MATLQTCSVGTTAACTKHQYAYTSAVHPATASMGYGACSKNASGRPGASESKTRTCTHATQRKPALAEEIGVQKSAASVCCRAVRRSVRRTCQEHGSTLPGQICTRTKAGHKPATRREYSVPLYRNTANPDKFAGRGKIKAGFLPSRWSAKIGKVPQIQLSTTCGEAA